MCDGRESFELKYNTREEKTLGIIRALTDHDPDHDAYLVNDKEYVSHRLADMDAGFMFMAIYNDDYYLLRTF